MPMGFDSVNHVKEVFKIIKDWIPKDVDAKPYRRRSSISTIFRTPLPHASWDQSRQVGRHSSDVVLGNGALVSCMPPQG